LTVRDTATGAALEQLDFDGRAIVNAAFSPDGAVFAEGLFQERVALARWSAEVAPTDPGLWGILAGPPSRRPEAESCPESVAGVLAVSPDGSTLLRACGESLSRLTWLSFVDARTLREVTRLSLPGCVIIQAAFSPDGHGLLVLT